MRALHCYTQTDHILFLYSMISLRMDSVSFLISPRDFLDFAADALIFFVVNFSYSSLNAATCSSNFCFSDANVIVVYENAYIISKNKVYSLFDFAVLHMRFQLFVIKDVFFLTSCWSDSFSSSITEEMYIFNINDIFDTCNIPYVEHFANKYISVPVEM
jgi:hypothetical protein